MHDSRKVAVFYEFMAIADPSAEKYWVESMCLSHDILGTVVIAHEGINAALLGDESNLDEAIAGFEEKFCALVVGWSAIQEDKRPFERMRVKVRDEIVTSSEVARLSNRLGDYVEVARWHELMDDPTVAVVDVRNRHETEVGTFPGAIDPGIRAFRDFPAFVSERLDPEINKRIAMFCTGGIRCEKASAFMLENGFEEVHQLKGGILGYLGEVSFVENRWAGDCFVFDQRISIDQTLVRAELVRAPRLPR